jgi:hypothetical protein
MAFTYYSRLTLVRPDEVNELDPRLGVVIAETATTGKFIMSDISWDTASAPNAKTMTTINTQGELKIYEPMGMAMFDYIKAAAFSIDIENHLDARFLLEIEVLSETLPKENSPYKYIWPIMFIASEVKSSVSEKGTEYNIKFIHTGHHAQTDLVQPIKETSKLDAGTVGEYLQKLQRDLETREFKYAAARQKAGSAATPGGDNPAASDPFHDEYHFIVQKEVANFKFTSKGDKDNAVQGTWGGLGKLWGSYNITARPGMTLTQQINRILQSTEESANLLLGRDKPQAPDATGSSASNTANLEAELGKVYQFFRIETFSVYKAFDYIRQRYAVKHVFFVFLSDQPNMYQYPDEIALINKFKNRDKAIKKLQYYIQEGLLQKTYYHNYTGLNTEILKVDINFNQSYSLPSFPVMWADRGTTGPGPMNLQNYNRRISAYVHKDDLGTARREIERIRRQAVKNNSSIDYLIKKYANGDEKKFQRVLANDLAVKAEYNLLQKNKESFEKELALRQEEFNTKRSDLGSVNTIKNRQDLLKSLDYAEDLTDKDFTEMLDRYKDAEYHNLNPRMEPDVIAEKIDIVKSENEKLMEKLFAVMISPRDLVELELEIFPDPFWLGPPNVLGQGAKNLDMIEFPLKNGDELRELLNSKMQKIDTRWNTREPVWGDYGVAPWYKGAPLFYFLTKVPEGYDEDTNLLKFNAKDQIHGIYMVYEITNDFKDGKWTQKLKAKRDISIPSQYLPTGVNGELTFEQFVSYVNEQPSVAEEVREAAREEERQRTNQAEKDNLTGNGSGAAGVTLNDKVPTRQGIPEALQKSKEYLADNPPPSVVDPVAAAKEFVASGMSKQQAYTKAKAQYENQVGSFFKHLETANTQAYAQAGVNGVVPYSADTMKALAIQRSGVGGLNDWRAGNTTALGPAALNNPMGVGGNPAIGRYNKFDTFEQGLQAGSDYYNYGVGVSVNKNTASDRLLLPDTWRGKELEYIKRKTSVR